MKDRSNLQEKVPNKTLNEGRNESVTERMNVTSSEGIQLKEGREED